MVQLLVFGLLVSAAFQICTGWVQHLPGMILVRLLHNVGDVPVIMAVGIITAAFFLRGAWGEIQQRSIGYELWKPFREISCRLSGSFHGVRRDFHLHRAVPDTGFHVFFPLMRRRFTVSVQTEGA